MARTIGDQFANLALGPVAFAGTALKSGNVDRALDELGPESLYGAVQRGATAVASRAGVPLSLVESVLPIDAMDALLARIEVTQAEARSQWKIHVDHGGGLLEAVAKLTADSRPVEAGMGLTRLATKMKLEKALAAPLRDLATQIDQWCELLQSIRVRLDEGKHLEQARRRRVLRRLAIAAVVLLALAGASGWALFIHFARTRVDRILASSEACDVDRIDAADLSRASEDQRRSVASRRDECDKAREQARAVERERAAAEERRRIERQREEERQRGCKRLGETLGKPSTASFEPLVKGILGRHDELFARVARRAVIGADITSDVTGLACLSSPAGDTIAGAFATAVVASAEAWIGSHAPSPSVLALLTRGKAAVDADARLRFARAVEHLALEALMSGDPEKLERARRTCALLPVLELKPDLYCLGTSKPKKQ
jgi:hypothetical protein